MSPLAPVRLSVHKELCALAPLWGAAVVTIAAAATGRGMLVGAGLLAFIVGSVALGAHVIGHEYAHRTLAGLLALPVDRRRVLLVKLSVLAPMLTALGAVAWLAIFRHAPVLRAIGWNDFPAPGLVTLTGLFVAPWLAMVSRSSMAGTVFSLAIPPMFLVAGNLAGGLIYGRDAAAPIDRLAFSVLWWGTSSFCVVGALAGWRTFMRLEAIDERGRDLHLPFVSDRGVRAPRRGPLAALIRKELRVQQLALVLFGLCAALALACVLADNTFGIDTRPVAVLTVVYSMLLSIIIGSLASAEERQLGTEDVQLLLPIAVWKQWAVKAGVAMALALALGVLAPQVLRLVLSAPSDGVRLGIAPTFAVWPVVVLTSASLYISSLSSSGVRAAVMSLAAITGFGVLFFQGVPMLFRGLDAWGFHVWLGSMIPASLRNDLLLLSGWTPIAFATAMTAVTLFSAFRNVRPGESTPRRIALQIVCIAAVGVLVATLGAVMQSAVIATSPYRSK